MNEKRTKMISLEELLYFGFFLLLSITKGFGFYDGQKLFLLLVIPALLLGLEHQIGHQLRPCRALGCDLDFLVKHQIFCRSNLEQVKNHPLVKVAAVAA